MHFVCWLDYTCSTGGRAGKTACQVESSVARNWWRSAELITQWEPGCSYSQRGAVGKKKKISYDVCPVLQVILLQNQVWDLEQQKQRGDNSPQLDKSILGNKAPTLLSDWLVNNRGTVWTIRQCATYSSLIEKWLSSPQFSKPSWTSCSFSCRSIETWLLSVSNLSIHQWFSLCV